MRTAAPFLTGYTAGVNAGLAALGSPPFEYTLLRTPPAPWRPEDSILVTEAMYLELQAAGITRESNLGLMHDTLPPALYAFLVPKGTEWDAPIVGGPLPLPPLPALPPPSPPDPPPPPMFCSLFAVGLSWRMWACALRVGVRVRHGNVPKTLST